MKEIIKNLNKHTLSTATGISYSRLRKYSAGEINSLTKELNNIDGYISRYRAEYDAALERERRERELAKLSFKESQMNNRQLFI